MQDGKIITPFSRRARTLYLFALVALFAIVLPIVLLYASGYRWKEGSGLVRTGGVFVSIPYSNASVYLNDTFIGQAGFLKHDFYMGDLVPNVYTLRVEREGARPWVRTMVVEEQLVTDARALLIALEPTFVHLVVGTTTTATTTRSISRTEYIQLFGAFTKPIATTTSGAVAQVHEDALFVQDGDVFVRWVDDGAFAPSNFCGRPSYCGKQITIERSSREMSTNAAFFGGGILYATKENGVQFAEADVRPEQVRSFVYPAPGADFRVVDGRVIIRDGDDLYELLAL